LPTFIGLGAFKAASTWLDSCLREHPEVYLPDKELHFFCKTDGVDLFEEKGLAWYESLFADGREQRARGDISPGYLSSPEAAGRIHQTIPGARFILIMRNPIERAHSHYHFIANKARIPYSFDTLIQKPEVDPHRIILHGRYAQHLQRFYEFFPRDRFLLLLMRDVREHPHATWTRICDHVGVDSRHVPESLTKVVNRARAIRNKEIGRLNYRIARRLALGKLDPVRRFIRGTGLPALVRRINARPTSNPPLTVQQRRILEDCYREDIESLEQMLECDLSHWTSPP